MRRYDDPVEVRKGRIGDAVDEQEGMLEGPAQFLWRGKLWKVRAVLAHWVETGAWWQSAGARAVIGTDDTAPLVEEVSTSSTTDVTRPGDRTGDLLGERELWRVEAAAGMSPDPGVFDLSFDWSDGSWQLVGCVD